MKKFILVWALNIIKRKLFLKEVEVWGQVTSSKDRHSIDVMRRCIGDIEYILMD